MTRLVQWFLRLPWLLAAALVLSACTPGALAIVNQHQAQAGLDPLTADEAIDLYCANGIMKAVTYFGPARWQRILDASDGPPDCPEPPAAAAAPAGYVNLGHGVYGPPIALSIRWCESRDNYTIVNQSGSSASGAYQYLDGTWAGLGYAARFGVSRAMYATPAQQDTAFVDTYQRYGTQPWAASAGCW